MTDLSSKYLEATKVIARQGMIPFPVNDTTISIIKKVVGENEEELDFIGAFKKKASQTIEELKETTGLSEHDIERIGESLARKGLIFNQPNSQGVMVFRLLPLMNVGVMEYRFMKPLEFNEDDRELARLFSRLVEEVKAGFKANYENLIRLLPQLPPTDRTVAIKERVEGRSIRVIPIKRVLEPQSEVILPSQSVEEIINKFEDIAVGYCFCRQKRMALGEVCASEAPLENCFTFGKSARHTIAQGFARRVTKEEALRILKEAEEAGLVHKAFHPNSQIDKPETSICNCCKDCCDTFRMWREGAFPLINITHHISEIDEELCNLCGVCIERCPTDALSFGDNGKLIRKEEYCIGCGVCARFCPEEAIYLKQLERRVQILPPL